MAGLGQMLLALSSYELQVSLSLYEMDMTKRDTIGTACDRIKEAAKTSNDIFGAVFD